MGDAATVVVDRGQLGNWSSGGPQYGAHRRLAQECQVVQRFSVYGPGRGVHV